ncbi:MAG: MFS transporter [Anaerolineaceae bacterium]|nr:MFS transporter [Anaerolineaceae bacterium]
MEARSQIRFDDMSRTRQFLIDNPIVLTIYLPWLLIAIGIGCLQPIMPLYVAEFGASYSLVGLVLGAEGIGQLLGNVPAGIMLRRYGSKRTLLTGSLGITLAILPLIWTQSIAIVLLMQFLGGFSRSLFSVAQHTYFSQNVSVSKRGRAISIYGGVMRIGGLIGPVIGGLLGANFGLRAAFPFYALLGAMVVVIIVIFVENHTVNDESKGAQASPLRTTLRVSGRILTIAGTASLLAQMIRASRRVLLPLIGRDLLGLDVDAIGLVMSIASAMDVVLFYPAGVIMDRFGRKFAILPCFAIQAVAMLLVPLVSTFAGLVAIGALIGFGNGLGSGTMMTLGSDLAPPETRGEFLSIWRLIGDGGFTGAPLLVGAVADALTLSAAAVVMAFAGFGAVAVFGLFVPETLEKSKRKRLHPSS